MSTSSVTLYRRLRAYGLSPVAAFRLAKLNRSRY